MRVPPVPAAHKLSCTFLLIGYNKDSAADSYAEKVTAEIK